MLFSNYPAKCSKIIWKIFVSRNNLIFLINNFPYSNVTRKIEIKETHLVLVWNIIRKCYSLWLLKFEMIV